MNALIVSWFIFFYQPEYYALIIGAISYVLNVVVRYWVLTDYPYSWRELYKSEHAQHLVDNHNKMAVYFKK